MFATSHFPIIPQQFEKVVSPTTLYLTDP